MSRRGFALITTLWLIVVLGSITAAALAEARLAGAAHRNRIALRRAAWAREACIEMLLARGTARLEPLARVDLGRGTWCRADIEDPSARLHLNVADPAALRAVLRSDALAGAVLERRAAAPFASVAQLREVRGFDAGSYARVAPHLTLHGDGRINLNAAPAEVLAAVPGFGSAAVAHVLRLRSRGEHVEGLESLAALLGREDRRRLLAAYAEATAAVAVQPSQLLAHVEAGVAGEPARDRATVTFVAVAERIATVRRAPR